MYASVDNDKFLLFAGSATRSDVIFVPNLTLEKIYKYKLDLMVERLVVKLATFFAYFYLTDLQ